MKLWCHLFALLVAVALLITSAVTGVAQSTQSTAEPKDLSADTASRSKAEIELGVCSFEAKDFSGAKRHFEAALALDRSNAELQTLIARAAYRQFKAGPDLPVDFSKAPAALAEYEKVLVQKPNDSEAEGIIIQLREELKPGSLPQIAD